jgi:aryl-alcohol dehydrogenase-like predicted oxidoreductase
MKYKPLGKSEIEISEIGFGCMSLTDNTKSNQSLLMKAFENGINYFDTADLYNHGLNERLVGEALKSIRSQVIISTKVGNVWRQDRSGWDWKPSKSYLLKAIDLSLNRLQSDYVDLYMLHGGTLEDPIDEIIEAFELLKENGKIKTYGLSSIRPNVIREYVNKSEIDAVMMQYGLLDRRPEESCLDLLHENKISVLARGTLAKGLLAGKPSSSFLDFSSKEVEKLQEALKEMADDISPTSDMAVQYVLHHPTVSSAVIGIRTKEQLEDAVRISESKTFNNNHLAKLQSIFPAITYRENR